MNRGLIALALLRLTRGETMELWRAINRMSPDAFSRLLRSADKNASSSTIDEYGSSSEEAHYQDAELIYQQITRLLQSDDASRLSIKAISDRVLKELHRIRPHEPLPQFIPKRGLRDWLKNLERKVPASEIYHAFAVVVDPETRARWSWPLK
jgi:hypothetical protein